MAKFAQRHCAVIFSLALIIAKTQPALAGSLTGVSITASNNDAGANAVYTISFTTSATPLGDIPANGRIVLGFPAGFDVSGVSLASNISGLTGGYSSVNVAGQNVTLQRDGTGNLFNGSASLNIALVVNHASVGVYSISVETQDGSGVNIDGPDNDTVSIDAAPIDHFTISAIASPQIAGADFSFTVSAFDEFNNPTSFTGTLSLSDNTGTLTPTSTPMSGTTKTVSNANITLAQSGAQITVSDGGNISKTSNSFAVNPGNLNYVKIVEGLSGNSAELTTKNLTADEILPLHAAGYDVHNNYTSDVSVTWGSTGTLAPAVSGSSASITFSPTTSPASGTITATHATATGDATGAISVSDGAAHHIKILSDLSGQTLEVNDEGLTAGGALQVHAASFDADENYIGDASATWSATGGIGTIPAGPSMGATFTASAPGSGQINASHATLGADATGTVTVNAGTLSNVKIVEGPSGDDAGLTTKNLTADETLIVHAAGYDASDNYLGDFTVTWGSTGSLAPSLIGTSLSITFSPTTAPASGTITATHATATGDVTGTISVSDGALHHVTIRSASGGGGSAVDTQSLTADQTLTVHAAGYDADNNFINDVAVTWTVSGGIGTISGSGTSVGAFTANTVGGGLIIADHSTAQDDQTGLITVTPGAIASLRILSGDNGETSNVTSVAMGADEILTLHAGMYDGDGNYIGDNTATWSSTGLTPAVSGTSTSITFEPTTSNVSGTITATRAGAGSDNVSVTVNDGALDHVLIRSASGGGGSEISTQSLTADQTLTVHAAGYDADNNFINDVAVTWTVSGGIGTISGSGTSVGTFSANTVGSGLILADHSTAQDDQTGLITVTPGAIASLRILSGDNGETSDVTSKTMTADDILSLHAGMFDGDGNYIGDNTATWSSTGLTPAASGTSISIDFDPTTSGVSGTITATRAGAGNDNVSVTVNDGVENRIQILSALSGNTSPITTAGLTTGSTLPVHAASFDADGNYVQDVSVTWSVTGGIGTIPAGPNISATFNATTPGSGQINAAHATLGSDATGTITVNAGNLSYVKIVEGLSGTGAEFTTRNLTADQNLILHAAGYDASNVYLGDFSVAWSSTGTLAPAVSGSGNSITFEPTTSPASGTITANHASATDDATGTITVSDGAAQRIKILDGLSGEAIETTTKTLSTGGQLQVHAASFDADGNYLTDVSVTWSVTGGIGTIPAGPSQSATFTATTPGTGQVNASHATLGADATGTITVNPGTITSIILRTAPNNGGSAFGAYSMTSDDSVTIYAAGYDVGNIYLGDVSVTWSRTGSLAPVSGSGSSFTFRPTTAPASGTIRGTHASAGSDDTGTITVSTGKPAGAFTLTANPTGIPADNATQSAITSSALRDGDNNLVGAGKKYTISITGLSDLTIVTADADAGIPGHQIATNASSILSFNVRAGATGGTATITAISVDNGLSSSTTTLAVGSINALAITAQPTVSQGQQDVVVQMSVRNIGTTTITTLAGNLAFSVGASNRNSQYNVTASPSNPTSIAGNTTATLSFLVDVNSAPAGETVTINGSVTGLVSSTPVSDTEADTPDSWTVQTAAALTVQAVSATPASVSRGQTGITVNVTVRNNFGASNVATANVDSVRLIFKSGATFVTSQYTISANAGNPAAIAGGAEATFAFTVDVSLSATLGSITIDARAGGRDANSLASISDLNGAATTDSWTVIDGGAFSIVSLAPSQTSVTAGMTRTWTVRMRLQNTSSSNIAMDLSPASGRTRIRLAVGNDTTGWSITKPGAFDEGGQTLNAGQSRHLTFTITQTANRTGTATISGFAGGTDNSTSLPVNDNTLDGGGGEVAVQSAANPVIQANSILTSQLTVTAGQTQDWTITVPVFNNGQSSIKYSKAQSTITVANGLGYSIIKPNAFADSDSVLDGFETKNLVFTVDVTGTQLGAGLPITAVFKGDELNSLTLRTSNTGSGSIIVQTAAQLQISSTTVTALNANSVNVSQAFSVNVQVKNLGEEIVDSLRVRLNTNGSSIIQAPNNQLIQNLINVSPSTVVFNVTAGAVNPNERFTASIISSRARNTQQAATISPALDDTVVVKVQNPSAVQVQVSTSVATVEAGQTAPTWSIRARVTNTGGAPLQLNTPAVSNISLSILGAPQTDYAITAPASLLHGGLTLQGGQSDTLVYTVTRTGEVGGTVTITANISGIDKNNNAARSGSGSGSINVTSTAAVRMTNVSPVVFRTNSAGVGFVNKSQSFQVNVTVDNTSLEAVRDVKVSLAKPPGSQSTVTPAQQTIASITAGNNATVNFNVTAANLEVPGGEIFEANIDQAIASASGAPARIRQATDSTAIVIIESRAALVMNVATDDADNNLTTDQLFQVLAKVDNLGQAPYDNGGEMRLAIPAGYQRENQGQEPLTRSFSEGETIVWNIRAPQNASGPDLFIVTIIDRPKDRNTDANAFAQKDIDTVAVRAEFSDLAITKLFVSSPAGGADSVLSTDQFFNVTANVVKSANLLNTGAVTLRIPQGYDFRLGDQDSVRNTIDEVMTWQLQAPSNAHSAPRNIALHVAGQDQQGTPKIADAIMPVLTVNKTSLALNAVISRPAGARGGQLSVNQTFYIRAELNNSGAAGTVGQARARINFGNSGVTTQEALVRDIAVNDTIEWEVKAPGVETTPFRDIVVSLERPYPLDENTGFEASTPQPSKTIKVITGDQGRVTITDVRVSFPSGAQDRIISSGQNFQITASFLPVNVVELQARLIFPADFRTATPVQIPSAPEITWDVTAPSAAAADQVIRVALTGKDSRDPTLTVTDTSDALIMQVVRRADLRLSAQIISPESATDGSVSIGQDFTVEAALNNNGQAQTIGADAIYLALPAGYTTTEPAIKSTTAGKAQWVIRARDSKSPSLNERINLELQGRPLDENTNDEALASVSSFQLPIFTEPKRLVVRTLPRRNANSVAQGEQGVSLFGLELQNQSDAGSSDIMVRGLRLTFRDRNGELLAPNAVLAAIRAQGYGNPGRVFGEVTDIPAGNPLTLVFGAQTEIVRAGVRDSLEVTIDLAGSASTASFYASLEDSADIDAIDQDSGQPVEIMDDQGRTGGNFEISSALASIISADFGKSFGNYPNPFGRSGREKTKFVYNLPAASGVELRIYSLLGELVWQRTFKATDPQGAEGAHDGDWDSQLAWDGRNGDGDRVLNGVYVAVLKTNSGTTTRKVAVVK